MLVGKRDSLRTGKWTLGNFQRDTVQPFPHYKGGGTACRHPVTRSTPDRQEQSILYEERDHTLVRLERLSEVVHQLQRYQDLMRG